VAGRVLRVGRVRWAGDRKHVRASHWSSVPLGDTLIFPGQITLIGVGQLTTPSGFASRASEGAGGAVG
jgi:hypothetical protein